MVLAQAEVTGMPWLAETNFTVPAIFGIGGSFYPFVHVIDETSVLMVFQADLDDSGLRIYAWPADLASDGTVTLHAQDEVVEVATVEAAGNIMGVFALPEGGYWVQYQESGGG